MTCQHQTKQIIIFIEQALSTQTTNIDEILAVVFCYKIVENNNRASIFLQKNALNLSQGFFPPVTACFQYVQELSVKFRDNPIFKSK
jgi:hypothetical protein